MTHAHTARWLRLVLTTALLASVLSACGDGASGKTTTDPGNSNKWDQMKWDQDKWS